MATELVDVVCPVDGTVTRIERGVGNFVDPDSPLVRVQSGEMSVTVQAGFPGVVEDVRATIGAVVEPGEVLVVLRAAAGAAAAAAEDEGRLGSEVDEPPTLDPVCRNCGAKDLQPGFVEDRGQGSSGYGRWVQGHLELSWLSGAARRMGRRRRAIEAYRCPYCSHLEFFATDEV